METANTSVNSNPATLSIVLYHDQSFKLSPFVWAKFRSKIQQSVDELIIPLPNFLISVLKPYHLPESDNFLVHAERPERWEAHFRSLSLFPSPYMHSLFSILHFSHGWPPEHFAFAFRHLSQACKVRFFSVFEDDEYSARDFGSGGSNIFPEGGRPGVCSC